MTTRLSSSSSQTQEELKNLAMREQLEIPNAKDFPSKIVDEELLSSTTKEQENTTTTTTTTTTTHYTRCTDSQIQYTTDAKSLFLIKKKTFSQQFSNLYFLRLKQMKSKLQQRAMKLYPDATLANRVLELKGEDEERSSNTTTADMDIDNDDDDEEDLIHKQNLKNNKKKKKRKMYIVVGTLYKEMKLKPNILQEYTREEFNSKHQPSAEEEEADEHTQRRKKSRISPDDSMVLEDVSGRVSLLFMNPLSNKNTEEEEGEDDDDVVIDPSYHQQQVNELVTGIIVALYGHVDPLGHFIVQNIIFSEYPSQVDRPSIGGPSSSSTSNSNSSSSSTSSSSSSSTGNKKNNSNNTSMHTPYVALVSGIGVGHPQFNLLNTQNMIDYLSGVVGGELEQEQMISRVIRVVVAGDSVWQDDRNHHKLFDVRGSLRPAERASLVEPSKAVDRLVEQLAQSVHVDVMPGENDPSNTSLPQQPLHPSLFPKSSQLSTCHLVTNPYVFEVMGGIQFLGVSGQTIDDLRMYSSSSSSSSVNSGIKSEFESNDSSSSDSNDSRTLELMEKTLRWSHLAPTAPDTLNCYPFYDHDPFILTSTPHVYFCGNQDKFETKLLSLDHTSNSNSSNSSNGKCVRLISLPRFVETGMIVLVNLRNLNVHPIVFDTEHLSLQ